MAPRGGKIRCSLRGVARHGDINADLKEAYDTLVVKEFDITEYCTTAARICEDLISRL